MTLVKIEEGILSQFNDSDKRVILAVIDVPIKNLDDQGKREAFGKITNILLTAYHFLGYNIPGTTKEAQAEHVSNFAKSIVLEVITEFPNLTIKDIEIIVHDGIREKYGTYMGFSLITIHKFAKSYLQERAAVIVRLRGMLENNKQVQAPPPTEQEWHEKINRRLTEEFDRLTQGKEVMDFGNIIYNYLVKYSILKSDDYMNYISIAEKVIKEKLNPRVQPTNSAAAFATTIIRAINEGTNEGQAALKIEAKRQSLISFLKRFKTSSKLSNYIRSKLTNHAA